MSRVLLHLRLANFLHNDWLRPSSTSQLSLTAGSCEECSKRTCLYNAYNNPMYILCLKLGNLPEFGWKNKWKVRQFFLSYFQFCFMSFIFVSFSWTFGRNHQLQNTHFLSYWVVNFLFCVFITILTKRFLKS